MMDSLAMRGANAVTGFVLSSLLVCGVIVVSDAGTYSLPIGPNVPLAEDIPPDAPTDPTPDAQRSSTRQSITVRVSLRSPRKDNARGAERALPASAMSASVRPDQQQTTDHRGDPRSGRGSYISSASRDRPERGERGYRTSSRHSATPARDSRDTAPARRAFRSGGSRAESGRGA